IGLFMKNTETKKQYFALLIIRRMKYDWYFEHNVFIVYLVDLIKIFFLAVVAIKSFR
ncbi:MAG: hypothetical protein H6Q21_2702, partial [Bacteroidetes bacterium]|nr:hypothetical protein [Bacteroidota bacterium]